MTARFRIEGLGKHDRSAFRCGDAALDRYFAQLVSQDTKRLIASCHIAIDKESERIAGFYTLAAGAVAIEDLPEDIARRLPRYAAVPAARVGRLAVDRDFQSHGLGKALLGNAAERALASAVTAFALVVDAKDDRAAQFYERCGFRPLIGHQLAMFLPLSMAQAGLRGLRPGKPHGPP